MLRFEAPWLMLLLAPLLLWVWWLSRRSYAQLQPAARWASGGLRGLMSVALLAALARPTLLTSADRAQYVFLLDVSRSVSDDNIDAAIDQVDLLARAALEHNADNRITVIAFGRQPQLLIGPQTNWRGWPEDARRLVTWQRSLALLYQSRSQAISENPESARATELEPAIRNLETFRDSVVGDATDIHRAMRLALNCGEIDTARRVYVLSDGHFTRGSLDESARTAHHANASIELIALDKPIPPEIAASDLTLPASVRVNQGFSADVHIASAASAQATVVVYKDGFAVQEVPVNLQPGMNTVRVPGLYFREKGFHTVQAVVRPNGLNTGAQGGASSSRDDAATRAGHAATESHQPAAEASDTIVENNIVRGLVTVPGEVRVLYVDSEESQMSYLKSALELEGMSVESRPAVGVPQNLSDLLGFDVFILSNVPADRLSQRQMQMIKHYVQDFGGGFIMLGGDQSFGLGGYFNTPVEEVLPVKMPIQKDMLRPSLAIMLVIDKSGSMEGVKIQLAKRAAIATADAINPRDQIGVIGFDGESRVILELTPAADRATISAQITSLEAGGGTFLYPALEDAYERLRDSPARRKHVLVLSDGQTQGFGYPEFVQTMAADGITLSAIGIGEGADMQLIEAIAMAGGGRAYFTNDFYSIPQIFTREALRASKNMLVERLVQPILAEAHESLKEIDADDLPLLSGYVATTSKPAAKTILISDSGDPILAQWRHGLGRSAAFTSDTKPRWAEEWIRWPDFAKFWSQLVRSVAGSDLARMLVIEAKHELAGDGVRLIADVRDSSGNFIVDRDLELSSFDAQQGVTKVKVQRDGPGLFSATLPKVMYGQTQQFAWHVPDQRDEGGGGITSPYGFVYSFSPEFRTLGVNDDLLSALEHRNDIAISRVGRAELHAQTARSQTATPLWPALLAAAILLAPLDILCRRLG